MPPLKPDSMRKKAIVVIAASARAAAESLRRAGYETHAVDAFGDRETRSVSRSWTHLDQWRGRLRSAGSADAAPDLKAREPSEVPSFETPWVLGGGLPEPIDWLDDSKSDSGLTARQESLVQQPAFLRELAEAADVEYPETYLPGEVSEGAKRDVASHASRWLVKPIHGTGGIGIHTPVSAALGPRQVLQRKRGGRSVGVNFRVTRHEAVYLGAARQLSRRTVRGRYVYKGSVGPLTFSASLTSVLERIGCALAERLPITGPCNVDVLIDGQDRVTLLEVNPRFSASMELLEWSWSDASAMPCSVFDPIEKWDALRRSSALRNLKAYAKRVLFAEQSCWIDPIRLHQNAMPAAWRLTDTPMRAIHVDRGDPVATVLAPFSRAACRAEKFFDAFA